MGFNLSQLDDKGRNMTKPKPKRGRPKGSVKPPTENTRFLQFRCSPEMQGRFKADCKAKFRTVQQALQKLVSEYLDKI